MAETITRACGCPHEFEPLGDRYDEARREKLRRKRCRECNQKSYHAEQDAARARRAAKLGEGGPAKASRRRLPGLLPEDAFVAMRRTAGGWVGTLQAEGVTVTGEAPGPGELVRRLAFKWFQIRAGKGALTGSVKE